MRSPKRLFLDRAFDSAQVFPKGVTRMGGALFEVTGELQLRAQRLPAFDGFCLLPFALPDRARRRNYLFDALRADEKAAVIVGKDDVARLHLACAEAGASQGCFSTRVEPLRTGWTRAVTENGEPDLAQFGRIAMRTPHDDAREATGLRFERGQISDAALVQAAAVVDDKDIALLRVLHRFQKHATLPKWVAGSAGPASR